MRANTSDRINVSAVIYVFFSVLLRCYICNMRDDIVMQKLSQVRACVCAACTVSMFMHKLGNVMPGNIVGMRRPGRSIIKALSNSPRVMQ